MKRRLLILTILLTAGAGAHAQFLKKLQEKAASAAEKVIDKKLEEKTDKLIGTGDNVQTDNSSSTQTKSTSGGGRMSNTAGAGLVTTPPDVKEQLSSAESAFKSENYGAARYAVQQAILGVEMEIGSQLLKSLPETVSGIPKVADADQVTSSGWGWAGLNISRTYRSDKQEMKFIIANNSMLSAMNQFLVSGAYGQSTGGQQKWKQVVVQGNKAVIEYDADSGYKLSVPLGQSSLLAFEGINFATEQDMLAAVNQFKIADIKNTLGEK